MKRAPRSTRDILAEERRQEAERIRALVLANVERHPLLLAPHLQYVHGMGRQSVYFELRKMVAEGILAVEGNTWKRRYTLLKRPVQVEVKQEKPRTYLEQERYAWANRKRHRR